MDGRVEVSFGALSRCRSDEAERASKARLFEHTDVRVRAGAREERSKGSRADRMSADHRVQREWLWLLSPKGK
jgi:hypothetical protein